MKHTIRLSLLMATCLTVVFALISCVSASYIHREYYPPTPPADTSKPLRAIERPRVKPVSFQPDTYAPQRGPIKSETEVRGQDSTMIWTGTGGLKGLFDGAMSFAGQIPSLYGIGGTAGIGAVLLGWSKWRSSVAHNVKDDTIAELQKKVDATWDEAYHKGYTAGVAARPA